MITICFIISCLSLLFMCKCLFDTTENKRPTDKLLDLLGFAKCDKETQKCNGWTMSEGCNTRCMCPNFWGILSKTTALPTDVGKCVGCTDDNKNCCTDDDDYTEPFKGDVVNFNGLSISHLKR